MFGSKQSLQYKNRSSIFKNEHAHSFHSSMNSQKKEDSIKTKENEEQINIEQEKVQKNTDKNMCITKTIEIIQNIFNTNKQKTSQNDLDNKKTSQKQSKQIKKKTLRRIKNMNIMKVQNNGLIQKIRQLNGRISKIELQNTSLKKIIQNTTENQYKNEGKQCKFNIFTFIQQQQAKNLYIRLKCLQNKYDEFKVQNNKLEQSYLQLSLWSYSQMQKNEEQLKKTKQLIALKNKSIKVLQQKLLNIQQKCQQIKATYKSKQQELLNLATKMQQNEKQNIVSENMLQSLSQKIGNMIDKKIPNEFNNSQISKERQYLRLENRLLIAEKRNTQMRLQLKNIHIYSEQYKHQVQNSKRLLAQNNQKIYILQKQNKNLQKKLKKHEGIVKQLIDQQE